MLAVDVLPYVVAAGADLLVRGVAETARVLRPGGELVVFNRSYRGDLAQDVRDAAELATRSGLESVLRGTRPLATWDGVVFRVRRTAS